MVAIRRTPFFRITFSLAVALALDVRQRHYPKFAGGDVRERLNETHDRANREIWKGTRTIGDENFNYVKGRMLATALAAFSRPKKNRFSGALRFAGGLG